jgi:hypothetical protein
MEGEKEKMNEEYKMSCWDISVDQFRQFQESEYAKLDKRLRARINWGCNCHFRIDKEFWEVLNEMFDYAIRQWKELEEVKPDR